MQLLKKISSKHILIAILLSTAFFRLYHLDFPNNYVFDEVYHGFTAKEYLAGHKQAWDPFATPPKGVAYEWTHPPLAKEIMTVSMFIFRTENAWAYRLPGVLLGVLSVYLIFLLGKQLFRNEIIGLISAFIFSIDGLNFVQSRIGMNDIYFITFALISLLLFLRKKYLFSFIFLGLSFASKWAAVYLFGVYLILLIKEQKFKYILYCISTILIVYAISYIPYFLLGYTPNQFIELQKQMWWYHTNLKATHDYASPWWSWPLNLYPVWYYVDYTGDYVANIFASGNPIVFWLGTGAILLTIWEFIKRRTFSLGILLLGYFAFWLPWAASPRIMFLYHYSPSVPFMALALGYQLSKLDNSQNHNFLLIILGLMLLGFLLMFPFLTGIPIPKNLVQLFFLTNLTKNPFGS